MLYIDQHKAGYAVPTNNLKISVDGDNEVYLMLIFDVYRRSTEGSAHGSHSGSRLTETPS